jgi:primosomal protein N' (replication factor Y)
VPAAAALVVATPGAEPRADGGYAAAVLLDGWVLLGRPSLAAAQEALRRWLNAAALVRPAGAGGAVTVVADAGLPAVQALIRWDPVTHADHELTERIALRFPPAARLAALSGAGPAVAQLLAAAELPAGADVLGSVVADAEAAGFAGSGGSAGSDGSARGDEPGDTAAGQVRVLIRVPRARASALAVALQAAQAVRSARKDSGPVRVQLDPAELI